MPEFISVAKVADVPSGEGRVFHVGRIPVAVFHVDGEFHALDNMCIHRGGPLGDGPCTATTVTCPWHGWQFDLKSGDCLSSPGESVDRYEVRIDGDDIQVKV
jgi:nitrite reductase (NADH) small subunit